MKSKPILTKFDGTIVPPLLGRYPTTHKYQVPPMSWAAWECIENPILTRNKTSS